MSSAVPERHPDQDQLADLAAEVLPLDVARSVEAHVMGCALCERLLADAERVRHLLLTDHPGPMPDDVWHRLEGVLTAEAVTRGRVSGRRATSGEEYRAPAPATGAFPVAGSQSPYPAASSGHYSAQAPYPSSITGGGPVPPVRAVPATGGPGTPVPGAGTPVPPAPPPSMSFDEAPTAAWKAFLDEPEAPPTSPVPLRVGRSVRASSRSRRDVRTEDREADRRSRLWIPAAAAAVLLLGGGIGAVLMLRDGDGAAPAAANLPGPRHSVVSRSGREYTAATLATQVKALLANPSATVRPSGSPAAQASRPAAGKGTVADPKQLQSCLQGLGVGDHDSQPVAVDLAKWQGVDAAVIVLPGRSRGYDVWVVRQQCTAGAESPLAFKSVPG